MHKLLKAAFLIGFLALLPAAGMAQDYTPKLELGAHLTALRLFRLGETPVGVGGCFTWSLNPHLALDGELNHFPENSSGNFGETQALIGVKSGWQSGRWGVYAKARPGVIHFGGSFFDLRLLQKTQFALDVGGVVEYYPSRHTAIRFDIGDTIIPFGQASYLSVTGPVKLRTTHNLQNSIGFAIRF